MTDVLIRGGGVAAACCAHLLGRAGFRVCSEAKGRPRLPAILLSHSAQQLICDVFERPDLFHGLPPIQTRIVSWGADATPVALPHSAVVISEQDLLNRLAMSTAAVEPDATPGWTIRTSDPAACRSFGSREAAALPVELSDDAEPDACWIESTGGGWLFLITTTPRAGWLLAVGDTTPETMASSRLIAPKAARLADPAGRFPAAPRIASPLCGLDWLACGSAAMAFDPLCGDGTAHAVREAILAAAVIQADANGEDRDALLAHYHARLTAGFQRHLSVCLQYYRSGHGGPWWDSQTDAIADGLTWCDAELRHHREFRYRLEGFQLIRIDQRSVTPAANSAIVSARRR